MPQEITRTAYTITELSEEARERALQNHHDFNTFDEFWYEHMLDDYNGDGYFTNQARAKGFEITTHSVKLMNGSYRQKPNIYFSGFWSQGDGASFEAEVDLEKFIKAHKLGRKYRMILANLGEWYVDIGVRCDGYASNHYSHSGTMRTYADHDFAPSSYADREYEYDLAVEREEKFESLIDELKDDVHEAAVDLADSFYDQLEKEYEYQSSEEQLIESLDANEMLFNADGTDF